MFPNLANHKYMPINTCESGVVFICVTVYDIIFSQLLELQWDIIEVIRAGMKKIALKEYGIKFHSRMPLV